MTAPAQRWQPLQSPAVLPHIPVDLPHAMSSRQRARGGRSEAKNGRKRTFFRTNLEFCKSCLSSVVSIVSDKGNASETLTYTLILNLSLSKC